MIYKSKLKSFNIHNNADAARQDKKIIQEVIEHDAYNLNKIIPIKTCLDLGAHIGTFSVAIQHRFPQANIISVEPHISSFLLLQSNVSNLCLNAAVGSKLRFVETLPAKMNMAAVTVHESPRNGLTEVKSYPLVELMDMIGPIVDLIKMDIEGSEIAVLSEMTNKELKRCRFFIGEWHNNAKELEQLLNKTHEVNFFSNSYFQDASRIGLFSAKIKSFYL